MKSGSLFWGVHLRLYQELKTPVEVTEYESHIVLVSFVASNTFLAYVILFQMKERVLRGDYFKQIG